MNLEKHLQDQIIEAVRQGIVSSKQVESNMLGSLQTTLREHVAILKDNTESLDTLNVKVGIQNGRITENEKQLARIQTTWTVVAFLGPTIIIMAVWVFLNQIETLTTRVEFLSEGNNRTLPSVQR